MANNYIWQEFLSNGVDDLAKKTGLTWARIQTFERSDDFLEDNNKSKKLIEIFNNHKIEFVDETDKHEPTILIKNNNRIIMYY